MTEVKRARVLLVDDNVDLAEMTADMLCARGFDVSVATSSLAALELTATFVPEVALLDIGLPEMDGYELARRLAESVPGIWLIAITGYEHDRARARAAGFAAHLLKPFTTAAILAAVAARDLAGEVVTARARTSVDDERGTATDAGSPDGLASVAARD
jgi:CheY-like chemotaxis protein